MVTFVVEVHLRFGKIDEHMCMIYLGKMLKYFTT